MSDTLARTRIEKGLDIANGCGLAVAISELHVGKVSMLFDTINVIGQNTPYEEVSIDSSFWVKFVFAAGYYIQASYHLNIKAEKQDMLSLESRIKAVQSLNGSMRINEDPSATLPFDNWYLVTDDADLLKECEIVNFSDDGIEPTRYVMEAGHPISFDDHWACSDVAYGLLLNIDDSKKMTPYPETGFTKEVVHTFDKQVRDAICDVLKSSHEANLPQAGK